MLIILHRMTWSTSSKTTWPGSWCSTTKYECSLRFWNHGLLKTIWPGSLGPRAPRWPGHPRQDLRNQGRSLPTKPDEDAEQRQTTILNRSEWFRWMDEQLLFETKVFLSPCWFQARRSWWLRMAATSLSMESASTYWGGGIISRIWSDLERRSKWNAIINDLCVSSKVKISSLLLLSSAQASGRLERRRSRGRSWWVRVEKE